MKPSKRRHFGGTDSHGRVRNPVGRSFKSIRGKYPSRKMGRMIQWESQLERDAILLLEYSSGILAYQEQPRKIIYVIDDKIKTYFPDFEVLHIDRRQGYIEVKPHEIARRPDQVERFTRITDKFADEGSYFMVLTEKNIRKEHLLSNLRLADRHRSGSIRPCRWAEQRHLFKHILVTTFVDAQLRLQGIEHVWALIADGIFITDLNNEITAQTNLLINHTREKDATNIYF